MMTARYVLLVLNGMVLAYFVLINAVYLVTSAIAFGALRRYVNRLKTLDIEDTLTRGGSLPVTLIAPAYNEEATCVEAVRSLLSQRYADFEVLVVNDGSKDRTLERLRDAFELIPAARAPSAILGHAPVRGVYRSQRYSHVWVVDKENGGGKADALNAGLAYCRTPLFCALDADTLLEQDAITRVVRPFLEDATAVASGGIVRIINDSPVRAGVVREVRLPRNFLARMQVLEYLRAYLAGRMGWGALDATVIISGAFGVFRRATVVEVGGFRSDTMGEDMELVVRLHRHMREKRQPYSIHFIPDPVAWTECPETVAVLGKQRSRWQRGLYETMNIHRVMLLRRRYGVIGMVAMPYYYFLEMMGPFIEAAGYLGFALALALGAINAPWAVAFFVLAFLLGGLLSVAALALEELSFRRYPRVQDLMSLALMAFVEPFGYRQLSTWWRLRGLVNAMRRTHGTWGEMTRRGFAEEVAS